MVNGFGEARSEARRAKVGGRKAESGGGLLGRKQPHQLGRLFLPCIFLARKKTAPRGTNTGIGGLRALLSSPAKSTAEPRPQSYFRVHLGLQVTSPKGHWVRHFVECNDQVNIIT